MSTTEEQVPMNGRHLGDLLRAVLERPGDTLAVGTLATYVSAREATENPHECAVLGLATGRAAAALAMEHGRREIRRTEVRIELRDAHMAGGSNKSVAEDQSRTDPAYIEYVDQLAALERHAGDMLAWSQHFFAVSRVLVDAGSPSVQRLRRAGLMVSAEASPDVIGDVQRWQVPDRRMKELEEAVKGVPEVET